MSTGHLVWSVTRFMPRVGNPWSCPSRDLRFVCVVLVRVLSAWSVFLSVCCACVSLRRFSVGPPCCFCLCLTRAFVRLRLCLRSQVSFLAFGVFQHFPFSPVSRRASILRVLMVPPALTTGLPLVLPGSSRTDFIWFRE